MIGRSEKKKEKQKTITLQIPRRMYANELFCSRFDS